MTDYIKTRWGLAEVVRTTIETPNMRIREFRPIDEQEAAKTNRRDFIRMLLMTAAAAAAPTAFGIQAIDEHLEAAEAERRAAAAREQYVARLQSHIPEDGFYITPSSNTSIENFERFKHALRSHGLTVTHDYIEANGKQFYRTLVKPGKDMIGDLETILALEERFNLPRPQSIVYKSGKAVSWQSAGGDHSYDPGEARHLEVPYKKELIAAARAANISPYLLASLVTAESGWDATVGSSKGAYGLTQLMHAAAAEVGTGRETPEQQLLGGARYLRKQLDRFGDLGLALAAYNAGPTNARTGKYKRFRETREYIERIMTLYDGAKRAGHADRDYFVKRFDDVRSLQQARLKGQQQRNNKRTT